jgi:T5SS/PEP-CTERM-associated repeat protein
MALSKKIEFSGKGQAGILSDPLNWAGGVVPGIYDTAIITENVGGPVAGTFSVDNVMLLGSFTMTVTGTLDTAGTGACQGLMVCDGATAIFAPGATLNDGNPALLWNGLAGNLIVGNDAVGTFLAQGSGSTHSVINTVHAVLGKQDEGVGTVTIDDGVWTNLGVAYIGEWGAGTLHVIDNGSVSFGGDVDMGTWVGSSGIMTIASGGSVYVGGTLTVGCHAVASASVGSGSSLTTGNMLTVGGGSELDLTGGTVTAGVATGNGIHTMVGGVIAGYGILAAADGGAIFDYGTIRASGGNLTVAGNFSSEAGSIQISTNSTATLTGSSIKLAGIAFIGSDATLSLAHAATVTSVLSGFAIGDIIAMGGVDAVSFNAPTGILTLSDKGAKVDTLHLAGNFAGDTFSVNQSLAGAMIGLRHV